MKRVKRIVSQTIARVAKYQRNLIENDNKFGFFE